MTLKQRERKGRGTEKSRKEKERDEGKKWKGRRGGNKGVYGIRY